MVTKKGLFTAAAAGLSLSAFLLFGLVSCVALVGQSIEESERESSGTASIESTAWVPEGFTSFNNKVATKWIDVPGDQCYLDSCYAMEVVASEQCSHVYVELALLDSAGTNVGYTNDSTSSLEAGQRAVLVFNASAGQQAKISKINCI